MSVIPVLNISMLNGGIDEKNKFILRLTKAAHDVGFFYLSGHAVSFEFFKKNSRDN